MKNLPIQSLEFDEIKSNFIEYLKNDKNYKDWNFEGSGISTLLNILSYNTHLIGYYVKMLLDESFIDTAHTREALLSHGKTTGYLSKGKRSAHAEIQLKVTFPVEQEPLSQTLLIPRGSVFSSNNAVNDRRHFTTIENHIIETRIENDGIVEYTSNPFIVREGRLEEYRFIVDGSILNQRFILRDTTVDVDTIKVFVHPHVDSNEREEYKSVDNIFELNGESRVFFVTTNEDGHYQIFFGNNVFGKQPEHLNKISVEYVSTHGLEGNGAKVFTYDPPQPDFQPDYYIGNFSNFQVTTINPSSGGMEPEDVEELRFSIPHHFKRQNRIVTISDYYSVLKSQYRNIDSMNVWGGEENHIREYGKTFVSIKPKFAERLTSSAKSEIRETIVEKYGIVGSDILFIDPEFINVQVHLFGKIEKAKTNSTLNDIRSMNVERMNQYNNEKLNQFGTIFSENEFLNFIKGDDNFYKMLYSTKVLSKTYRFIHRNTAINSVTFGNPLFPGIVSGNFLYAGRLCYLKDDENSNEIESVDKEIQNPIVSTKLLKASVESYHLKLRESNLHIYNAETHTRFLNQSFGFVDYENGIIHFRLPEFAVISGFENAASGLLRWTANPIFPDIIGIENNILRITSKTVTLTQA